jgi:hypothetical protein
MSYTRLRDASLTQNDATNVYHSLNDQGGGEIQAEPRQKYLPFKKGIQ